MITKLNVLQSLRPGAEWVLRGDGIEWLDRFQPQPTDVEIAQEFARLESAQSHKKRIAELKQLLADTDYKVLPDYDKPDTEVVAQRQAWRDEIRQLEAI